MLFSTLVVETGLKSAERSKKSIKKERILHSPFHTRSGNEQMKSKYVSKCVLNIKSRQRGRIVESTLWDQNLFLLFCCVPGIDILRHFPLLGPLSKQL